MGDILEAIKDLNQAIFINPIDSNLYFNRGDFRYKIGNIQGAIEDFNLGIKINPINANGLFMRGQILSKLKEYEAAIEDYSKSMIFGNLQKRDKIKKPS
ncbi:tetratricopeptide repeat protein [Calothrix sp. CCY 0018]|uniref:tetratricopeptide repeat protein n=1 Tax=Calothrix sp. CCY 0018 TaxID=3103864 RepID=UPI0039C69689